MKKVICIVGPTGSGKSKLSIELAKHIGAEIINGDSVSMYKKLDIGSAKIMPHEMDDVPHHLIDHVLLNTDYTVYHFQKDVRSLINKIEIPLIVGGSGLYIKSALYDYQFNHLEDLIYPSFDEMVQTIQTYDPAVVIDLNNVRRVESAYRLALSGQKRSDKVKKNVPLYDIFLIYLDLDRLSLRQRVTKRLDKMLEQGFIDEVKSLIQYDLNIIGYREIKAYLNGAYNLNTAKDKIVTATMRYAKRQRTWFINQMHPKVYDALSLNLIKDVMLDVKQFLGEHNI